MQNQDERNTAEEEVERVRRHVEAVRERIRAMYQSETESEIKFKFFPYLPN